MSAITWHLLDSLKLAWNAMAVDFSQGSHGRSAEVTMQHAMAGEFPDGSRQTYAQAITATNAFIRDSISNGNLAGAIHAAQDLAAPRHAGQPWRGFRLNWETAQHILGDTFPTWSTINQAYQNTKGILNQAKGCSR